MSFQKTEAYDDKAYQWWSGLGVGLMGTGHRELPGGDRHALLLGGGAGSSVPLSEPIVHLEWEVLPRIPNEARLKIHTQLCTHVERESVPAKFPTHPLLSADCHRPDRCAGSSFALKSSCTSYTQVSTE